MSARHGDRWKSYLRGAVPNRVRRLRGEFLDRLYGNHSHHERMAVRDFLWNAFRALQFNEIDGDYAEFGCCGGQTFGLAATTQRHLGMTRQMWAFDSFKGLPAQKSIDDEHPAWIEGDMAISLQNFHAVCKTYGLAPSDYRVVPGFYEASLANPGLDRTDFPRRIALAYIDCDLYHSTRSVLAFLEPRLRHGMILAFDDYFCWSTTACSGERKACTEHFDVHARFSLLPYIQYGWHGMSFVVEDRVLLSKDWDRSGPAAG